MLRYFLILLVTASGAIAQTAPTLIPFQGRLTDQQGQVRTNGVYTLIFNLYDQAVGGNNLWTERHERVGVVNGMVNVFLGSITPLDAPGSAVNFTSIRYLGITVDADNNSNTADPEMVPRQMIIPAFWAKNSDKLAGADWSSILVSGNNPVTGFLNGARIQPSSIDDARLAPRQVFGGGLFDTALGPDSTGSLAGSKIMQYSTGPTVAWDLFSTNFDLTVTSSGRPMWIGLVGRNPAVFGSIDDSAPRMQVVTHGEPLGLFPEFEINIVDASDGNRCLASMRYWSIAPAYIDYSRCQTITTLSSGQHRLRVYYKIFRNTDDTRRGKDFVFSRNVSILACGL